MVSTLDHPDTRSCGVNNKVATTPGKTAVFLLEDDARIRERFRLLINNSPNFVVAGEAYSLSELSKHHDAARSSQILLVDLRLPDGSGKSLIRDASTWQPRPRIIVVSALGDEKNVVSAVEAGADGYLLKDVRDTEFIPLLEALLRGESPMSPAIARHLLKRFRPESVEDDTTSTLSKREVEVLELIAKGFTYGEIGQTLGIATSTVITHVKHTYSKLDVNSRSQAVFEAANLGIIKVGR